jgi:hypothetical protein
MPLKKGSTENGQPAMKDETAAAPAATATATPGSQFEHNERETDPVPATVQAPATALATQSSGGKFGSMDNKLAFGAFPQVKLDKDKFVVGEEGEIDAFDFKPLGSQSRWIYKRDADEFFFTYDNVTATDGRPVQDILNDWKAEGTPLKERREYQEVYGYIMDGEFAERMVVLSIPPASVPRLAGLRAELQAMKNLDLDQVIIHIEKGSKIKTKAGQTFYPWKFSFKSLASEYAAEGAEE